MKYLFLLLLAIVSTTNVYSQSRQDGFVKEYNEKSKKKPLAGVQVLVANASRDVSGKDGDFHLQFLTLKPGDPVKVHNIFKSGYEIFNKEQLEVWRISNRNEPFTIVMCKGSVLKALKDEYNAIAYKSYEEQRAKEMKLWKDQLEQGKVKQEEYEKQIATLCDYYDKKLNNLDAYIDRFARIDMSVITREERRIVELVRKGLIQEAIDEYNALKLDEELIKNYQEYQKADSAIVSLTKVSEKKHAYEEELLASLNNKFNLMMMQGSRQAIDEILKEYEKLAEKCPHSINILRSFVDFAMREGNYMLVVKWGRALIELLPDDKPYTKFYYSTIVSNAERFFGHENEAILYNERAAEWLRKYMDKNPSAAVSGSVYHETGSMIDFALIENGLVKCLEKSDYLNGVLDSLYIEYPTDEMRYVYYECKYQIYGTLTEIYLRLNDVEKAIECNGRSVLYLDSLQMIDNSDRIKSKVVTSLNDCGYLQLLIGNYDNAERFLKKAEGILTEIYKSHPYELYAAKIGNMTYLGMVYFYSGKVEKAIETYKEAISSASEIIETRPYSLYFTSYAELINSLGFVGYTAGDYTTAEEAYVKAIDVAKPFAERNPYMHLAPLCVAQINLATLRLKQGRLDEFLAMQEGYWNNVEKVYGWFGKNLAISYAVAWDNKGYYALLQGDTDEALSVWKKISDLVPAYLDQNPVSLLYYGLKERGLVE